MFAHIIDFTIDMHTNKHSPHLGLKILASKTRFNILQLLRNEQDGLCVKEIAEEINLSHSATSHQLAHLEKHNIVKSKRAGQTNCYRLQKNKLTKHINSLLDQC